MFKLFVLIKLIDSNNTNAMAGALTSQVIEYDTEEQAHTAYEKLKDMYVGRATSIYITKLF
jgi:hypothetical protein